MTHGNDIDPLPAALAPDFPQFAPDDLVISYATTNLLFVLDPESLKVKWWRVGITDYQPLAARQRGRRSPEITAGSCSFRCQ